MTRITLRITIALFMFLAFQTVNAQDVDSKSVRPANVPVITGTASAERLRFTAPSTIVQMQLQIYAGSGQVLFDVTSKGNVLDWTLQDSDRELVPGSYLCVVTVKSLSGELSQRIGSVLVQEKQVELKRVDATLLSAAEQQAVGSIEENGALTILKADEFQAATVLANNGKEGQLIRGRGALTFRVGDLFSGTDHEQMRLTEDGRLGIGTDNPQATLDVAGTVRASKGVEFADGTVQTTGLSGRKDKDGNIVPNVAGTGTHDMLAKWIDDSGGLGNSIVTETASGFIGLSNSAPSAKLSVLASAGSELRFDAGAANITPVLSVISQPGSSTLGGASVLAAGGGGSGFVFSDNLPFVIVKDTKAHVVNNSLGNGTVLMTVTPAGNLGIGTPAPSFKLEVIDPAIMGLRVQTNTAGGNVASFGGFGAFQIDAPGVAGGRFAVKENGNVGIGTGNPLFKLHVTTGTDQNLVVRPGADFSGGLSLTGIGLQSINDGNTLYQPLDLEGSQVTLNVGSGGNVGIGTDSPAEKLSVAGTVQSTSGGFKFPDGSVQTAAATNATTFTKLMDDNPPVENAGFASIIHLDFPTGGTYLITATVQFVNTTGSPRGVDCKFDGGAFNGGEQVYTVGLAGNGVLTTTLHSVLPLPIQPAFVDLQCQSTGVGVLLFRRRLTAVKLGNVVVQ